MKYTLLNITASAVLGFAFIGGNTTFGQASIQTTTTGAGSVESTTTTSEGTVSEFSPQTIVVKTAAAEEPIHYTYSKSTTYMDQDGNPVSIETVKSGLPVTVYYVKDGDNLVASKVIVRKIAVEPAARIQDSKTTTTTTTTDK